MKVLIAGCGWLGTALGEALVGASHGVVGLRRHDATALRAAGIEPLTLDLRDPDASRRLPSDVSAIVACQAADGPEPEAYRRAYVDATAVLLSHARRCGVGSFVVVGSTGVFGQDDGGEVDERSPAVPASETGRVLADAEARLAAAARDGAPVRLVRLSGLYGPGRYGAVERVRTGALALGPGDDAWMNWCHRDDAVALLWAVLERGRDGAVYHGSDASPMRRRDFVAFVAERLGIQPQRTELAAGSARRGGANRRVSGAASRAELGLALAFPSCREGLAFLPGPAPADREARRPSR